MIEQIKIAQENDLFGIDEKTISFGQRNIIIGPKGGGKSTMFDLLANISKGKIFSTTIDALKHHNLKLISVTINGEEIPFGSLIKVDIKGANIDKKKSVEYDKRNDVIYQDDPIKKNISQSKSFDKKKIDFAKSIVSKSSDVREFVDGIQNIFNIISKVTRFDDVNINWANSLSMTTTIKESRGQLIFNLNYTDRDVKLTGERDMNYLNEMIEKFNDEIGFFSSQILKLTNQQETFINKEFLNESIKEYKDLIKFFEGLITKTKHQQKDIKKIMKISNAFNKAYIKNVGEIKKESEVENKQTNILNDFKTKSIDHFTNLAKELKKANIHFEKFISSKIKLEFDESEEADDLLELSLKGEVIFTEDQKFGFMKTVLHNAKKSQESVSSWILAARAKAPKDFKEEKIITTISRDLKEKIKVLADGNDYETMSLGQKSIYGIKYKFKHSVGNEMFLDQPEDNLDNYTIANDILELIKNKKEQMFTVTHNANIGILSKPDYVIIGAFEKNDLSKQDTEQYKIGTIVETKGRSDTAHFLEGGTKFIEDRLKIIKGEN